MIFMSSYIKINYFKVTKGLIEILTHAVSAFIIVTLISVIRKEVYILPTLRWRS